MKQDSSVSQVAVFVQGANASSGRRLAEDGTSLSRWFQGTIRVRIESGVNMLQIKMDPCSFGVCTWIFGHVSNWLATWDTTSSRLTPLNSESIVPIHQAEAFLAPCQCLRNLSAKTGLCVFLFLFLCASLSVLHRIPENRFPCDVMHVAGFLERTLCPC